MRLLIDHQTRYDYAAPATGIVQLLRLTPRGHDGQQVLHWRIEVDADGWMKPCTDAHGNRCHIFYASGPTDRLTLTVTGEVVTSDTSGVTGGLPAGGVTGGGEEPPLGLYRRSTPLTAADAAMAEFARDHVAGEAAPLGRCHALMRAVHAALRFDADATQSATDAATAFGLRAGVCQDISQIFVACARQVGVPARYVSGHYAPADHPEQEASHAWAEAWIDGLGWVGFDPTHGVCPGERHVRVAVGLDALDAAPVRGARRGGGAETLSVVVRGVPSGQHQSGQQQWNGGQTQTLGGMRQSQGWS